MLLVHLRSTVQQTSQEVILFPRVDLGRVYDYMWADYSHKKGEILKVNVNTTLKVPYRTFFLH